MKARIIYTIVKDVLVIGSEAIFRLITLFLLFLNGSRGDGSKLSSETLKTKNHMAFKWQMMLYPF